MTNPISMAYLKSCEEKAIQQHPQALVFGTDLIYRASDVIFALMYDLGPAPPPESPEGEYRTFAFERFGEAPYTVRAIDILSVRGHYPEALALVRVLVESFVQLRYFVKFPDRLVPHMLAKSAKDRVRWVEMFDEFSPGFYSGTYSLLSSNAHSGMVLSALLPAEPSIGDQPAKSLGRHGCVFNEKHAALVLNMTAAMIQGFLLHFRTFFPAGTPSAPLEYKRRELGDILSNFVKYTITGEMLSHFTSLTAPD